jgi:hypothetical protein
MKLEFSRQIFKNIDKTFHENPSVGAELLRADGQIDMTELTVAFRSSANKPNKVTLLALK